MLPRPPTSTLFPYTTLFRSRRRTLAAVGLTKGRLPGRAVEVEFAAQGNQLIGTQTLGDTSGGAPDDVRLEAIWIDRKSTRLNSSHTVISYAVFCLKKKRKTN